MSIYRLRSQDDLVELAARRGWIEGYGSSAPRTDLLAPCLYFSRRGEGTLPTTSVRTEPSVHLRIPEAVVHGGNFSLILEDQIFPGGFAHSFWPSPAWKPAGNKQVSYEPREPQHLALDSPSLLGMVSHWGHFFVDALDRLLELETLGATGGPLLVSDPDFFGFQPLVDEKFFVPQVSEIVQRLGTSLEAQKMVPIRRQFDYSVSDLLVCTLSATKPALGMSSLLTLRQRVLGGNSGPHDTAGLTIFVGRQDVKKRYIIDQASVVAFLAEAHGVQTIYPEHLTTAESVSWFSAASRVILPVGSAKFNLAYCRPGTEVVCITPTGYAAMNTGVVVMTRHLCQALGLKLAFYEAEIEEREPLINSNLILKEFDVENIIDAFDALG